MRLRAPLEGEGSQGESVSVSAQRYNSKPGVFSLKLTSNSIRYDNCRQHWLLRKDLWGEEEQQTKNPD